MKALIVYESMFGNTERVAHGVAAGWREAGGAVRELEVRDARADDLADCDLLVVGAPTHAFSLSRPSTREEAVHKGAPPESAQRGVREWIEDLDATTARPPVAVFDTRAEQVRHLPGSAARRAARLLRARGFELAGRPTSFYVADLTGPLTSGAAEEARSWGAALADLVRARASGDVARP